MTPLGSGRRVLVLLSLAAAVALAAGPARADVSKKVQAKFRGQILVSDDALPDGVSGDDAGTIGQYQRLVKKEVSGEIAEDVASWAFYTTSFLAKAPGTSDLSLDFYRIDGKKRVYVANVGMQVDPATVIVASPIQITEDDNVVRGTSYEVVLSGKVGGHEVRLAKTTLTLTAGAPAKAKAK